MNWPIRRRRTEPPTPPRGPAIQRAEHEQAKARLLALARQRRADHLHDGPMFGPLP